MDRGGSVGTKATGTDLTISVQNEWLSRAVSEAIGAKSFEELIDHIPEDLKKKASALVLPDGMSELELTNYISSLAAKNHPASKQNCFLGGGSYRRFVPAIVSTITSRSEFATAYTPYQPEASQGSLQAIYEFQTAICLLTGMAVANASMYDGPTACAEAALMAGRLTGRKHIVISETVNPEYRLVTQTYVKACDWQSSSVASDNGITNLVELLQKQEPACVIVQYPNYFGCIEDLKALANATHSLGALLVVVTEPISLGYLESPGNFEADIVVGDAQSCGNSLSFGGPSAGYMACRQEFIRQLPGRIAGMTVDKTGQRAYTLALQTREQHIRRAKANSNICTNQALNALAMLVYLVALGPEGLRQVALLSMQKAHYLAEQLAGIPAVKLAFPQPFFNEFAYITNKSSSHVLKELLKDGILGGLDLSEHKPHLEGGILVATTEMNSRAELDHYIESLRKILTRNNVGLISGKSSTCTVSVLGKTANAVTKL
jgi:glycine dehydrogenase subunit 1